MRSFRRFLPALILAVVSLVGCSSPSSPSPTVAVTPGSGTTPVVPTVTAVVPAAAATAVAINSGLTVTFSVPMDPATVSATTFTLAQGSTAVSGTVTNPSTTTANFAPAANLASNTVYTATLSTAVKSAAGVALAASKVWSFTTSAAVAVPTVGTVVPISGATGVALKPTLSATFSVAMAPLVAANFTLAQGSTPITGIVANPSTTNATFIPNANLTANTVYTATLSAGIKSAAGSALAAVYTWSFTTGTAPTVISNVPILNATGVSLTPSVVANFSAAMNQAPLTSSTFTLAQGATPVSGAVTSTSTQATFIPTNPLVNNTVYTATLTSAVKDALGNALASNYSWTFTTLSAVTGAGPVAVNLGTSGNYAILAKAAISTTGVTSITGHIAVSPAAASFITGFALVADASNQFSTSTELAANSYAYASDYSAPTPATLTTAVSDMQAAYTAAANTTLPAATVNSGAGSIGGLTYAAGLYKWTTGVNIATDLTLTGGVNDVFIFQITGDLSEAAAHNVILSGGVLAKNIFWQVSGQVSLGTTSVFNGNILCQTSISVLAGATVNGRLLAQTNVALSGATIVEPAP